MVISRAQHANSFLECLLWIQCTSVWAWHHSLITFRQLLTWSNFRNRESWIHRIHRVFEKGFLWKWDSSIFTSRNEGMLHFIWERWWLFLFIASEMAGRQTFLLTSHRQHGFYLPICSFLYPDSSRSGNTNSSRGRIVTFTVRRHPLFYQSPINKTGVKFLKWLDPFIILKICPACISLETQKIWSKK